MRLLNKDKSVVIRIIASNKGKSKKEETTSDPIEKLAARLGNLDLGTRDGSGTLRNITSRLFDLEVLPGATIKGFTYAPVSLVTRLIEDEELGKQSWRTI